MSHEEAGGLVLLLTLVLMIVWVLILRWDSPAQDEVLHPTGHILVADSSERLGVRWTPETSLTSAGSPCRAPGCPAMRYAPLDEHSINAHHRHDNARS